MWEPDGWNRDLLVIDAMSKIVGSEPTYQQLADSLFGAGADAMHRADVKWLKDHSYLLKYAKEGKVEITIKVITEDWQAFTGGEIL